MLRIPVRLAGGGGVRRPLDGSRSPTRAYWASTDLAEERGPYSTFKGSLWDRGILPFDTLKLLAEERGGYVECDMSMTLDWEALRKRIHQVGMRNSNCIAIAPTATIANITGLVAVRSSRPTRTST